MDVREKLAWLLENLPQVNHYEAEVQGFDYVFYCAADYLLANGVTVQEWIPVTEKLPDDDIPSAAYLCYWRGHTQICKYHRTRKCFEFNGRIMNVTHWMPLPQPPKEGL